MKVRLAAGCRDGLDIEVPDHLTTLLMTPEPPPLTLDYLRDLTFRAQIGISPDPVTPTADLYCLAGVLDDGTRVFAC